MFQLRVNISMVVIFDTDGSVGCDRTTLELAV